uniref:Uncharacterized protein n=1 Tax=Zooxanthella nutricula TaxID=1333877 RepID=A0A7S2QN19_9DINO
MPRAAPAWLAGLLAVCSRLVHADFPLPQAFDASKIQGAIANAHLGKVADDVKRAADEASTGDAAQTIMKEISGAAPKNVTHALEGAEHAVRAVAETLHNTADTINVSRTDGLSEGLSTAIKTAGDAASQVIRQDGSDVDGAPGNDSSSTANASENGSGPDGSGSAVELADDPNAPAWTPGWPMRLMLVIFLSGTVGAFVAYRQVRPKAFMPPGLLADSELGDRPGVGGLRPDYSEETCFTQLS